MARRRAQWTKYRERIAPSRLVFIDETWTKTNMAPLRGWAPRGQRIKAKVPHGRWQTMTFLAALRHDRITAPWFFDGPINGEAFRLYVENVLVPTLQPGDIAQKRCCPPHYPCGGRATLLPSEILARFEPDRTVLLQTQTLAAQGCKANNRGRLQCDRSDPRHRLIHRVRKLLRQRRL